MTFLFIYLVKVIAIQGALFLFYHLFLRSTRRHQLNRIFLLVGLIMAFTIPFIELPSAEGIPIVSQNEQVVIWLSQPPLDYEVLLSPIEEKASTWSIWVLIPLGYIIITLVLLIRSAISLIALNKFKRHSEAIKKYWFKLFKTSHSVPFSFFSNVFIPKSLFDSEEFDQVLAHECVHVKQRHSVDRLLLDFVVSLFWFNPFMYLYRNALIEIHEYQADEAVVKRFKDSIRYQEILFSQLQTPQYSDMVSHFNVSTIKKRIVMMNKQNKRSRLIYLVAVPLTLMMIFAFSNKEAMKPIEKMGSDIAGKIGPNLSFSLPEINFQNNYTPSILPLRKTEKIRMSSGFGKRIHPIYKVEKMHMGVDFSCPVGYEVLTSADGIVEEIQFARTGYGNMVVINHGDKYKTLYAQLSEINVEKGSLVKRGQLIALSGNSGSSTGPHLHYEVIENGKGPIDPQPFITNYEFSILVKGDRKSNDVSQVKQKNKQEAFRVIIDPGHGGKDSGESYSNDLYEKDLVLSIAEKVKEEFGGQEEIEIFLTRDTDQFVSLKDREASAENADLFISLHSQNYNDSFSREVVLMYSNANYYYDRSKQIATVLNEEFNELNEGECSIASFSSDGEGTNEYWLLNNLKVPAVMVQFNLQEEKEFNIDQSAIASRIATSIRIAAL